MQIQSGVQNICYIELGSDTFTRMGIRARNYFVRGWIYAVCWSTDKCTRIRLCGHTHPAVLRVGMVSLHWPSVEAPDPPTGTELYVRPNVYLHGGLCCCSGDYVSCLHCSTRLSFSIFTKTASIRNGVCSWSLCGHRLFHRTTRSLTRLHCRHTTSPYQCATKFRNCSTHTAAGTLQWY